MNTERRRGENGWWILSLGYWHTECNQCSSRPMCAKEMTELYKGMICDGCGAKLTLPSLVPIPSVVAPSKEKKSDVKPSAQKMQCPEAGFE